MTENQDLEQEQNTEVEVELKNYCIHVDSYKQKNRSFITFASSRLCSLSHDAKTFKADNNLINTFKQCCSKQDEFYSPNMSIRETIFRIFLANGNQPLNAEQLSERLQSLVKYKGNPRNISTEKLARIVDNDSYYEIRPVE